MITTFTKKQIIEALRTELPNLDTGNFFKGESTSNYDVSRYPHKRLKDFTPNKLLSCKVCAIGAVLRQTLDASLILGTDILTQAAGAEYCIPEEVDTFYEGCSDVDVEVEDVNKEKTMQLAWESETVQDAVEKGNWLSVLSQVFESFSRLSITEVEVGYVIKLVEEKFPDSFTLSYEGTHHER